MAYTNEAAVREHFQAQDTALVPSTLVLAAIDDAHGRILPALDPEHDTNPPADTLALGETILAGAVLLRALASGDAVAQQHIAIGGQRVQEGDRFAALMAAAAHTEKRAWETLAPYLTAVPPRGILRVTDSVPVLGED